MASFQLEECVQLELAIAPTTGLYPDFKLGGGSFYGGGGPPRGSGGMLPQF